MSSVALRSGYLERKGERAAEQLTLVDVHPSSYPLTLFLRMTAH